MASPDERHAKFLDWLAQVLGVCRVMFRSGEGTQVSW